MNEIKFHNDRRYFSTDNNGFAGNERDENFIEANLIDTRIPNDDRIPDGINEIVEDDRPVYDEQDYHHEPGV